MTRRAPKVRSHKPANWPRYMTVKKLALGTAYYWSPQGRDMKNGCPLRATPLGPDYGVAVARCDGDPLIEGDTGLNGALDDWRAGRTARALPEAGPVKGTIDWWFKIYQEHERFQALTARSQAAYARLLRIVAGLMSKDGKTRLGTLHTTSITDQAANRIYNNLMGPTKPKSYRKANFAADVLRFAWRVGRSLHPDHFAKDNPFKDIIRTHSKKSEKKYAASREEAYKLAYQLRDMGHPGLGAVPIIFFELLQRPENVLSGAIQWQDYQPGTSARIEHLKTAKQVSHSLVDNGKRLYPELEAYLAAMQPIGPSICMVDSRTNGVKLYTRRYAHELVAEARGLAALPAGLTLAACRHGGMTELGDAGASDQQIMATSGHVSASSVRPYTRPTNTQRVKAARRRALLREEQATADEISDDATED